jgi:hypothetical protein
MQIPPLRITEDIVSYGIQIPPFRITEIPSSWVISEMVVYNSAVQNRDWLVLPGSRARARASSSSFGLLHLPLSLSTVVSLLFVCRGCCAMNLSGAETGHAVSTYIDRWRSLEHSLHNPLKSSSRALSGVENNSGTQ